MLTKKQTEVLNCAVRENPKILICHGAKRSGKTFILTYIFLGHIARYRGKGVSFILGGATLSAIRRNVIDDIEEILGHELRLNRHNAFELFGNRVYCFEGARSDAWKKVRGFTAAGAFLNEGTALHDTFVKEAISRCSYPGARILIDTNPEDPSHPIKRELIDLEEGSGVRAFHFSLFDNTAIDSEYVDSMVKTTPSGMFYDRDILGKWVAAAGVVYPDFKEELYIKSLEGFDFTEYFAGVDWGYEHFGAVVLLGTTDSGETVFIEEYAQQHMEIDHWVQVAKSIKARYGNIPFYCDTARPEHIARFRREGIRAKNADKAVLSGIEQVARRFKAGTLKIYKRDAKDKARFADEIYQYVWNERTGEPVKLNDDVLDALRYAVYTHYAAKKTARTADRRTIGIW